MGHNGATLGPGRLGAWVPGWCQVAGVPGCQGAWGRCLEPMGALLGCQDPLLGPLGSLLDCWDPLEPLLSCQMKQQGELEAAFLSGICLYPPPYP